MRTKKSCVFRITEATFFVIEVDQSDYNNKQKRLKMKKKKAKNPQFTRNLLRRKKNRGASLYLSISIPFSVKLSFF